MGPVCRFALVALALLFSAAAFAASYPTTDQMRAAIEVAAAVARSDGLVLRMEDARAAGVTLPLMAAGLNINTGICQIYYNPAPEDGLARFFAGASDSELPLWLAAIAIHETTHCFEQREAYVRGRFDKVLPPGIKGEGMTLQGYLGVVKSGAIETWGEALADIASVLYLRRTAPGQWMNFTQAIIAMRHGLAAKWPSHDTSPWLRKLLTTADETPAQASCFEAAFPLRRSLRPQ